jgi:hypothetical protein
VGLFLVLSVAFMATGLDVTLRAAQLLGTGLFLYQARRVSMQWILLAWFALALITALAVHGMVHGEWHLLAQGIYGLTASGVALTIYLDGLDRRIIWTILLGFALLFIIRLAQGVVPNDVLPLRSRNHISVIVLALALLINLMEVRSERKVTIAPALFACLLCLLAVGRGGIITSLFYLGGVLVVRRDLLVPRLRTIVVAAGVSMAVVAGGVSAFMVEFVGAVRLMFRHRGIESDAREEVLYRYLTNLDPTSMLVGHSERFVETLPLTLHYSYLQWHHLYGVAALLLAMAVAGVVVRAASINAFLAIAAGAILLRSLTDTVLFPGVYFDTVFLVIVLMAFFPPSRVEPVEFETEVQATA